jgi:hypothetical protein
MFGLGPRKKGSSCSVPPDREAAFRAAVEASAATINDAYANIDSGVTLTVAGATDAAETYPR